MCRSARAREFGPPYPGGRPTSDTRSRSLLRRPLRRSRARTGFARVDVRTKRLVQRAQPGDIAVIEHEDLDRVSAESLIDSGVAGVVNAGRSITGRYPNRSELARWAGITQSAADEKLASGCCAGSRCCSS